MPIWVAYELAGNILYYLILDNFIHFDLLRSQFIRHPQDQATRCPAQSDALCPRDNPVDDITRTRWPCLVDASTRSISPSEKPLGNVETQL